MSEHQEILVKGTKGDKGEPGLTRRVRYGLVVLFTLGALFAVSAGIVGLRAESLARQALAVVHRHGALCVAISQLAAEMPPPGSAAANPSRAYLQEQHATFAELHRKFDCN